MYMYGVHGVIWDLCVDCECEVCLWLSVHICVLCAQPMQVIVRNKQVGCNGRRNERVHVYLNDS